MNLFSCQFFSWGYIHKKGLFRLNFFDWRIRRVSWFSLFSCGRWRKARQAIGWRRGGGGVAGWTWRRSWAAGVAERWRWLRWWETGWAGWDALGEMCWSEERIASGIESNPRRVWGFHARGEVKGLRMRVYLLRQRRAGRALGKGKQETGNRSARRSPAHCCCFYCLWLYEWDSLCVAAH